MMALFAKLTPFHVEATIFAFMTGVMNFTSTLIGPYMGAFYNKFVGVTNDDLSKFYILMII